LLAEPSVCEVLGSIPKPERERGRERDRGREGERGR
jgi:hypothetical protein